METDFLINIIKCAEQLSGKDFTVTPKGDNGDLVTNLDLEIEKCLISQIHAHFPGYGIVSEEFNNTGEVTDNCFIIDPIDGTVNFANGLPIWGIQIACVKDGQTIASVIDLPRLGELYHADESGAYLNGEKISIHEVPIKNTIYSIIGHDSLPDMPETSMSGKYSRNFRNFGAACATFAFMASGRIHGVVFRVDQPWDYAPGLYLCEKAGAKVRSTKNFHAAAITQEFLDILAEETSV